MEWTSVGEKMPELSDVNLKFLCVVKSELHSRIDIRFYVYFDPEIEGKSPYFTADRGIDGLGSKEKVTHWCGVPILPHL
jgi:hypothetical protein